LETLTTPLVELPPPATSETYLRRDVEGGFELYPEWFDNSRLMSARMVVSKSAYVEAKNSALFGLRPTVAHNKSSAVLDTLLETLLAESPAPRTEAEQVRRVVRYVQAIPYAEDSVSKKQFEHYRSGEEILVDGCGDCDDTAFLLAGLLAKAPFGYRTAIGFPPGHAVALVHAEDIHEDAIEVAQPDLPTISLDGEPYIPIETTRYMPIGMQWKETYAYALTDDGWTGLNVGTTLFEGLPTMLSEIRKSLFG
jgi:hypothetical protein